jgi:4-carboxymuconolactone decarboxylase
MPRIELPTPETMDQHQRKVYEDVINGRRGAMRGALRAAIHNPELAQRWQLFGEILRYQTSFPPQLSELSILAVARHWHCQLAWHIHEEEARKAGLDAEVIAAIRRGMTPEKASQNELYVYAFTAELLRNKIVSDTTYTRVLNTWGTVGAVELATLVGYYSMVAMTLNAHEIHPPPEVQWPLQALNTETVGS